MAKTISELEQERAKLLEAIEAQANQLSKQRGTSTNEARPHTLNDWLNAAEQVVPSKKEPSINYDDDYSALVKTRTSKPFIDDSFSTETFSEPSVTLSQAAAPVVQQAKTKPTSSSVQAQQATHAKKASVFGVVIMLSLLLTVLGVIYVAYNAVQRDLQQLATIHSEIIGDMALLEQQVVSLREQVEKGGDPELFDQFIDRIDSLGQQLNGLQQIQQTQTQQVQDNLNINELVTDLENQIQARLDSMLSQWKSVDTNTAQLEVSDGTLVREMQIESVIAEPTPPAVPRVEQKVVRLVEAKKPQDLDVNWLLQQPAEHFLLQLASMPERSGVEKVMADKRVQGGRIIPQLRDGRKSYVLVVGGYQGRAEANQKAIELKEATGISPWVRRVRDLSSRVE
ncbi:SPOR domain-containing protein [Thiomicrospira microaerophila]|uniref:SPOR domain-containing protein n=1 Tax=Thiomicrospira microaerophila TaxID=406020 RepID=UPI00200C8B17|nr:SPOR domain-containing protein [Thiomicrospira microaerophila]UQB41263.1 SPOR domain-containing protein [Thiomicrospira microaerophila]